MKSIVLNATNKSLEAVLSGAIITTQPSFVCSYADVNDSVTPPTFTEGISDGVLNNTTPVTLVSAPGSNIRRIVTEIIIFNDDTVAVEINFNLNNNSTIRKLWKESIAVDASFVLSTAGVPASAGGGLDDGNYGDITIGSGGTSITINDNAVTLAKLATQAGNTILAEVTGSTAVPTAVAVAANKFLARASTGNLAAKDITDFVLSLLDDANAATFLATLGFTASLTELNYTDGVTNAIQPQLDAKASIAYVDAAVVGLLDLKGSTNASTNPNYPAALKGDVYIVTAAGKVGGASGKSVDVGDTYFATADNAGGTEASVGTSWSVLEHNLAGVLLAVNNLSDLANASTALTNLGLTADGKSLVTATDYAAMKTLLILTDENIQDLIGAMLTGNTETGITVTYDDAGAKINFVVSTSGKVVGQILNISQPATLFPQPVIVGGGSTPAERVPAWAFDPGTIEYLDFLCYLSGYSGGGLTIQLGFTASATSGNVVWSAAIRRIADDAEDIDTSQTYDYNDAAAKAVASASRELAYTTITFTDGADMDNVANNEYFILRIRRVATSGSDTLNSNDAELWLPVIKET